MSYNILGINPGHNGSIALVSDGELVFYLEEERLSKIKYESNPLRSMFYTLERYKIDEVVLSGVDVRFLPLVPKQPGFVDFYTSFANKFYRDVKTILMYEQHHLAHAANTFYNSGFDQSAVLVVDSVGSTHYYSNNDIEMAEVESIFSFQYPDLVKVHYKSYFNTSSLNVISDKINVSENFNLNKTYEAITLLFGWDPLEGGKTMGLSSYGKTNKNIPPLFINGKGNPKIFKLSPDGRPISNFKLSTNPQNWHHDSSKISNFEKDLAYHVQIESEKEIFKLVEKTLDLTKLDKIACAGGYFLNCVCNYKLLKKFPNVKFYFSPTSHDAGNSIGAALFRWYQYSKDTNIFHQKNLYNGPQYTKTELINSIKNYTN